ncbi:hypothetical protein KUV61_04410 [Nocardioides marinus]|nr:hypothetical protein [Nocardioides marinus]
MPEEKKVYLNRLILHEDNPRFEGVLNEERAINALCSSEKILELAKDIAENGLSPLERFMVFQEDPEDPPEEANYVVAEGNRRLCALKLLKDPKRAPATMREAFQRASKGFRAPRTISVVIEEDEGERRKWIERAHAGTMEGKGRKAWNTTQKTRFFQNPRNLRGQALMDYAVARGFISKEETFGRLSHVVRLVGNPVMRAAIGLSTGSDPTELFRNRPAEDFDKFLVWLLDEALNKRLGSQVLKRDIEQKANSLEAELGCSHVRLPEPVSLSEDLKPDKAGFTSQASSRSQEQAARGSISTTSMNSAVSGSSHQADVSGGDATSDPEVKTSESVNIPKKPKLPKTSKVMPYSEEVADLLEQLGNYKLSSLLYSISSIPVKEHVPALYVTAWSFLDSFSVAMGRKSDGNISQFWQAKFLRQDPYNFSRDEANAISHAVDQIRSLGNTTKHHPNAAGFDGQQLKNDWQLILPIIELALRKHLKK